ncbi:MAG: glycosyltransferase family 9 protein [Candidatus Wallbacteria bacterium]|nr:glycosyltransferase family 9 protein [Candidatus Wallbacteria bacterium]
MRVVRADCRHYLGDRPCGPHKREGAVCEDCGHFQATGQRILIVKLDAMGDVLRTTCVLEPLARASTLDGCSPHVTWVTRSDSLPLLSHNPWVSRAVAYGHEAIAAVETDAFDRIVCLDASQDAARLSTMAMAASRRAGKNPESAGFMVERGVVVPTGPHAETWWQMGLWDDLKKANTRSYQSHMMEMLGLDGPPGDYVLALADAELAEGVEALRTAGLRAGQRFLAINVGGGGRWEYKRWTEPHLAEFMRLASERLGLQLALFGGDFEMPLIARLMERAPRGTFFPGVHPVRKFASMLAAADALVTGDTLAMHLSLAVKRPTVVLFGPTSVAEIEVYGRGVKLAPEMDCLCCYLPSCDKKPYCQELIEPSRVLAAVQSVISGPNRSGGSSEVSEVRR